MSITLLIVGISVVVSFMALQNKSLFYRYELNPYVVVHNKQWYRLITHAAIHADWMHLFVNMFVLWSFGKSVESYFMQLFGAKGALYFVLLYIGGVIFAALPGVRKHQNNPSYNAVGASGAVAAVLFASILFNPMSKIYIMFIPIGIPAILFGVLYVGYEVYASKNSNDNIAHDAHYWGALFGLVFTIALEPSLITHVLNKIFG